MSANSNFQVCHFLGLHLPLPSINGTPFPRTLSSQEQMGMSIFQRHKDQLFSKRNAWCPLKVIYLFTWKNWNIHAQGENSFKVWEIWPYAWCLEFLFPWKPPASYSPDAPSHDKVLWYGNWLHRSFHLGIQKLVSIDRICPLGVFPKAAGLPACLIFTLSSAKAEGSSAGWTRLSSSTSCIYPPSHSCLLISGQKCDNGKFWHA